MKSFSLYLALIFTLNILKAQETIPKGIYYSFEQIILKAPADSTTLLVTKRSKNEILMMGGNDYKIESTTKNIKKAKIKNDIVAYSDGEQLYINCFPLECQPGFAKVDQIEGNTLLFSGAASENKAYLMGTFGGSFGALAVATERYLYRLNLQSGELIVEQKIN